jgi:hypothetical protein
MLCCICKQTIGKREGRGYVPYQAGRLLFRQRSWHLECAERHPQALEAALDWIEAHEWRYSHEQSEAATD